MRKFVRHPVNVPIDIEISEGRAEVSGATMINVSAGGLAFRVPRPVLIGASLSFSIPHIWPDYNARGIVVWCREVDNQFEAGVQFQEANEAFKARMVAQFCQIEDYRRQVAADEGRELSSDEAAREWILQHAESFADTVGWQ